jgi:hypothetical protein
VGSSAIIALFGQLDTPDAKAFDSFMQQAAQQLDTAIASATKAISTEQSNSSKRNCLLCEAALPPGSSAFTCSPPCGLLEREHASRPATCSKCNTPSPEGASFCPKCGTPTADATVNECRSCHKVAQPSARFCIACGGACSASRKRKRPEGGFAPHGKGRSPGASPSRSLSPLARPSALAIPNLDPVFIRCVELGAFVYIKYFAFRPSDSKASKERTMTSSYAAASHQHHASQWGKEGTKAPAPRVKLPPCADITTAADLLQAVRRLCLVRAHFFERVKSEDARCVAIIERWATEPTFLASAAANLIDDHALASASPTNPAFALLPHPDGEGFSAHRLVTMFGVLQPQQSAPWQPVAPARAHTSSNAISANARATTPSLALSHGDQPPKSPGVACNQLDLCYHFNNGTCKHPGDHQVGNGKTVRHLCCSCFGPHPNFRDGRNASCRQSLWPTRPPSRKEREALAPRGGPDVNKPSGL